MKKRHIHYAWGLAVLLLSGCATWSTSQVEPTQAVSDKPTTQSSEKDNVLISKDDIKDRPYTALGDITVKVNKTTVFHPNPTPEMVDEKLREEGAKLGADAVVLVRYGKVGMSLMSYGSMEGKGRAIKFTN